MPPQGDLDYHRYADQGRSRIDNAQTYAREKIAVAITRQRRNYNQDAKEINVGEKDGFSRRLQNQAKAEN
jgi:hypothetical protein